MTAEMDNVAELWRMGAYDADAKIAGSRFQKQLTYHRTVVAIAAASDLRNATELMKLVEGKGYVEIYDYIEHNSVTPGVITNLIMMAATAQKKLQSAKIAESGGNGRAFKFKALEAETIKLYQLGKWETVPLAAQEITPKIVALSKNGNGDLVPTTTKPVQWIRAYVKAKKSNPS